MTCMSPYTLKGDIPNPNCIRQSSLSACPRTDKFRPLAAAHHLFTLLPDKLTDLVLVYDDTRAKLCMWRSSQESEHFCTPSCLTRTLKQRSRRSPPLLPFHPQKPQKSKNPKTQKMRTLVIEKEGNPKVISHTGDRKV